MKPILFLLFVAAQPPQAPPVVDSDLEPEQAEVMSASGLPSARLYPRVPLAKVAAKDGWVRPRALIEGKVTLVKKEDDGDIHFRVEDGGEFVVCEIIPELPLKEHPKVGERVKVWGVVRWDGQHKWGELHPVVGWQPIGTKGQFCNCGPNCRCYGNWGCGCGMHPEGPDGPPQAKPPAQVKPPAWEWKQLPDDPAHAYLFESGIQRGGWDYARRIYASYDAYAKFWRFDQPIPPGAPKVPPRQALTAAPGCTCAAGCKCADRDQCPAQCPVLTLPAK